METKLKFYNACVLSTLLYAAECWTLTERDEARLDAFDMRCQRKILRVRWSQHISNNCIRSKTKQPQLTSVIRKRRLQWFGHLQRMNQDRIPKRLYLWKPTHGRCKPGRPKTSWRDVIHRDISRLDLGWTVKEAEVAALDRRTWKLLLSQAAGAEMHDADW